VQQVAALSTLVRPGLPLAELVLPSRLPGEVLLDKAFQRNPVDEVVEPSPVGDVADHQHPLPLLAQWHVVKKPADPRNGLPPALPARIGPVQVIAAARVVEGHGMGLKHQLNAHQPDPTGALSSKRSAQTGPRMDIIVVV
jgi:hypothetical protein